MIRILPFFLFLVVVVSCTSRNSVYKVSDSFVDSLQSNYESYGFMGVKEHLTITEDSLYQIAPIGRLINVKILTPASQEEYNQLRDDLARHYEGDPRVNDVYICQAGTVMIDCRN